MGQTVRIHSCWHLVVVGAALGCASNGRQSMLARKPSAADSSPPTVADPLYRIGVGDRLAIRRPGKKEAEQLEVRGDGCIELRDGTAIRVDNRTTGEITDQLAAGVAVEKYNSQFINVYGLDNSERAQATPYRGKESLTAFLGRVGCRQWRSGAIVKVVRPASTLGTAPEVHTRRYDESLSSRAGEREMEVRPNDYVYIERDRGQPATVAEANRRRADNPFTRLFGKHEPRTLARAGD